MPVTYQRYTLAELAVAALKYLDISTETTDIAVGGNSYAKYVEAQEWANIAQQELADFGCWNWLKKIDQELTIAAAAWKTDLPADFHSMLGDPYYENGVMAFAPGTIQGLQDLRAYSITAGQPYVYSLAYNRATAVAQLLTWPVCDAARIIHLGFASLLPKMAATTDEPSCPTNLHRIVLTGTLAQAEERGERTWNGGARQTFIAQMADAWAKHNPMPPHGIPLRKHDHFGSRTPSVGYNPASDFTVTHP